ncbi:hypothetical protein CWI84_10625 [Idiomarina tyrosinivorans]|uniref:2-dehydropantoate 2-reductase n=1 Tax=Idiomarina tyrosinivorans TaxID=1445662 RepID=A0A432ZLL0_9GAMM|nr:2-dehydropantoate 2-reductase [Idiomarina tyrosinivorans]RUO78784.1 hypothetical protein CWI84_10625 [Idiomarina tyrosinivorans]
MTAQRWLVIGHGALGSLFAFRLRQRGFPVSIAGRDSQQSPTFDWQFTDINGVQHSLEYPRYQPKQAVDAVLCCVKTTQLADVLRQYAELRERAVDVPWFFSFNGFSDVEQPLKQRQTWLLVTTDGVTRQRRASRHAGIGQSWLGPIQSEAPVNTAAQNLANSLGNCQIVTDITEKRWQKFAVNCVINPLTAIHDIPNGELLAPHYQSQILQLLDELVMVALQQQVTLDPAQLYQAVVQVARATATNYSSMLQDIKNGNPTEIAALNGWLLKQAEQRQIALPAHQQLVTVLNKIEHFQAKP